MPAPGHRPRQVHRIPLRATLGRIGMQNDEGDFHKAKVEPAKEKGKGERALISSPLAHASELKYSDLAARG